MDELLKDEDTTIKIFHQMENEIGKNASNDDINNWFTKKMNISEI